MGGKLKDTIGFIADPAGLFGGGKESAPEVVQNSSVEALPQTPTQADSSVAQSAEEERRKRRSASGTSSTLLTSGSPLSGATTQKKTLLGA